MVASFEQSGPEIVGNDYLVIGVIDRKDWRHGTQGKLLEGEVIERMFVFKDVWNFEPIHAGWYADDDRLRKE